jgi:hypothetical protein
MRAFVANNAGLHCISLVIHKLLSASDQSGDELGMDRRIAQIQPPDCLRQHTATGFSEFSAAKWKFSYHIDSTYAFSLFLMEQFSIICNFNRSRRVRFTSLQEEIGGQCSL